jgi:large subunit ribosomal protein L4
MKVDVLNTKGKKVEEFELPSAIFTQEPNQNVIYEAVKAYLANQRLGTASTKTRGEVSGSGAKPWRQKGTGRARFGSRRNPIWRGGGVAFGPKPRSFKINLSKQIKKSALISSLSQKAEAGKVFLIDSLKITSAKTKRMARIISALSLKKPLFVLEERTPEFLLSIRNIPNTDSATPENLCAYYILSHDEIVFTKEAIERLKERLTK